MFETHGTTLLLVSLFRACQMRPVNPLLYSDQEKMLYFTGFVAGFRFLWTLLPNLRLFAHFY
jgi:hypothetical protein